MTIKQAIDKADLLRQNQVPNEVKIGWLKGIDFALRTSVIALHEQNDTMSLGEGADISQDEETLLLAPVPYDEIYTYWLLAQLDFSMGEIARYNNSIALYNEANMNFAKMYKAMHLPIKRGNFKI